MNAYDTSPDPEFEAWRDSLPPKHWAQFDLTAARQGWNAYRDIHGDPADLRRKIDLLTAENERQYREKCEARNERDRLRRELRAEAEHGSKNDG